MTSDLTTTSSSGATPGTALAIVAPKPTVSKQQIAWVERQRGLVGDLKLLGCIAGGLSGMATTVISVVAIIATHGAAIPVLCLFGGTSVFGGSISSITRRENKELRIVGACREDARKLADHAEQRGKQVLREAIEQGIVLTKGMDLPVQVDTNEWKILHITGISPDAACDSKGKMSYSAIMIEAKLHDVEPGCKDGKLMRGRKTRYESFGYYYHVSTIHHRIEMEAPVELAPAQPQNPAPESILRPVVEPLWGAEPANGRLTPPRRGQRKHLI